MSQMQWSSRWIFILAAIGSAAGLGNLWRFPYLAFEYGGGTFLFAIIIANLIIGIPLLALEVGLGQMTQKGAPDALGHIRKGFRYLGWFALMLGFLVIAYYMAVFGYGIDYLFHSLNLSWAADTKAFFFNNVLQISSGPGEIGGFSTPVLLGFIVAWIAVYFSVWKGVHSVSKVVKWSVTLPFILLGVLITRAVTLDGATEGLQLFFTPDFSAMANPELWIAAFSQVFFSLSLAFGVMIAYASLNHERVEITKSVVWIAVGNFLVSLMSGIVVFGTLGWMAKEQGVGITEVFAGGPGLTFVVFPQAITLLPALSTTFGFLFFVIFATLALDSAFSLLEGLATAFRNRFPNLSTKMITLNLSIVLFLAGLIFTTRAGLYYLDILDHFIVNYGLVIVGLFEAIAVGWIWKTNKLQEYINDRSDWKLGKLWNFSIVVIIPLFLTILLVWNIINEFKEAYEGYPVWALLWVGVAPIVGAAIAAYILEKKTSR